MNKKLLNVAIGILLLKPQQNRSWQLFFQLRLEDGPFKNYLEFPGGKIEEGEVALQAVGREWNEEVEQILGLPTMEYTWHELAVRYYDYPDRQVTLHPFYHIASNELNDALIKVQEPFMWLEITQLEKPEQLDRIIPASREIIDDIKNLIQHHLQTK